MKKYEMDIDNAKGVGLTSSCFSILMLVMKERLMDEVHSSDPHKSKKNLLDEKTHEYADKLKLLEKRLQRGIELIFSKLK